MKRHETSQNNNFLNSILVLLLISTIATLLAKYNDSTVSIEQESFLKGKPNSPGQSRSTKSN